MIGSDYVLEVHNIYHTAEVSFIVLVVVVSFSRFNDHST